MTLFEPALTISYQGEGHWCEFTGRRSLDPMTVGLDAIFLKAMRAEKRGDTHEARQLYRDILASRPNNGRASQALARLAGDTGATVATLVPELDSLIITYRRGDYSEAAKQGELLAHRYPGVVAILRVLGAAYLGLREYERAEDAFSRAIRIDASQPENHNNLGSALRQQGRLAEAKNSFSIALDLKPDYVAARYNLGNLHREARDFSDAVRCYAMVLETEPNHSNALNNLGNTLRLMGHVEEAMQAYDKALLYDPGHAEACLSLGHAAITIGELDKAHSAFSRALEINPGDPDALANRLHQEAHFCDWHAWPEFDTLRSDRGKPGRPFFPFLALSFEDDPARQLSRSRAYAANSFRRNPAAFGRRDRSPASKIRVGYFSSDFHNHATLCLMGGLLREHDHDRFEIRAYSYGADEGGDMRDTMLSHVDAFINVRDLSDPKIVELAHSDGLDIAVDLKGYTTDSRTELFASRLAPVQISFLGYPGSLGADFMDYIIADPVVIPEGESLHYSEKIIRLPGSYQANDNHRVIGDSCGDRASFGLPSEGFVFCCFNQTYKIGPREFDIWMRLLHNVKGSVLWLFRSNRRAEDNLRREAATRGINPERLIFAQKLPNAEHLARHRHADLFLDTFAVNAHTTASDALWGGLPVLTMAGRQFAARVGASLLTAIGLPDLITSSEAEYEAKAIELALSPDRLALAKKRLDENRTTYPLFDTIGYARHIEAAFEAVHRRHQDGLQPEHMSIT
jgi:predicted O-linked N-acetylglucosamine transferase (SPINDLY family)